MHSINEDNTVQPHHYNSYLSTIQYIQQFHITYCSKRKQCTHYTNLTSCFHFKYLPYYYCLHFTHSAWIERSASSVCSITQNCYDPKVFKLGIGNDLGISWKWHYFGIERSRSQGQEVHFHTLHYTQVGWLGLKVGGHLVLPCIRQMNSQWLCHDDSTINIVRILLLLLLLSLMQSDLQQQYGMGLNSMSAF